jgi:hypothetical protein
LALIFTYDGHFSAVHSLTAGCFAQDIMCECLTWGGIALLAFLLLKIPAIMLLLMTQILESVAQLTEQEWKYELSASCIEVYNNTLR